MEEEKGAASPKEYIENLIAMNKVMMFSKSWCPFCAKAKNVIYSKYL